MHPPCVGADGDIFLCRRVDDLIVSGGENVYPQDVEQITLRVAYCAWPEMIGFTHVTKLSERWTAAHSKAAAEAIPET